MGRGSTNASLDGAVEGRVVEEVLHDSPCGGLAGRGWIGSSTRARLPWVQQLLRELTSHVRRPRHLLLQQMAARGEHTKAESEFRDVLPHLERKLGPDHPVTLVLWFSIAQEMVARGDYATAGDEFRDMLPHLRQKLGPDHPDTLAADKWIDYLQSKENVLSSP